MRNDLAAVHAEQSVVAFKHKRSIDFLYRTPDSPQENCYMSRGTLG